MDARYGINLSFCDDYDAEQISSEKTVNFAGKMAKGVIAAMERFEGLEALLKSEQQADIQAPYVNEKLLQENGFSRDDELPQYLEDQLYEEREPLTDAEIDAEIADVREELYDAIYHVQRSLKPNVISALGDDYYKYSMHRWHDEISEQIRAKEQNAAPVISSVPKAVPENNEYDDSMEY